MANGYTGTVLRVDLSTGRIEKQEFNEQFYRTYVGGGAVGTYFLLKETTGETDPLDPANVVTIAPGVTTGAAVSGVSRCCITALSPATGAVGDSQAGGSIGPMVKRAGYDAIVVTGKAAGPSYLLVDGPDVDIRSARHLWGRNTVEVYETLVSELGKKDLSVLQCGPAGEKGVRFGCLLADRYDMGGRTGMGAVFGSKNLRAVAVRAVGKVEFADPQGLKALNKKASERLPLAGFPTILNKYGTPGVVGNQAKAGNLATHNYSRGFHPEFEKLDGSTFESVIGAGATTCYGCVVRCRKKVKADEPYPLTDELGGPEFETIGLLGSNLDIMDPAAVARFAEMTLLLAVVWPQAGPAVYALLAASAWRHYDVIYRIRNQEVLPDRPAWLLLLGTEGRVLVASVLLLVGVGAWYWFALYLAVVAVGDSLWSWFGKR